MASSFERGFLRKLIVAREGPGRHFVLRLLLERPGLDHRHSKANRFIEPRALEESRAVHAHLES
jgi:hypothetical protein